MSMQSLEIINALLRTAKSITVSYYTSAELAWFRRPLGGGK